MALASTDITTAVNAVTIDGVAITAAQFTTLLQYAAFAMQRDEQLSKAAIQQATNTSTANAGATSLANYQNAAAAAQSNIANLLGGQTF